MFQLPPRPKRGTSYADPSLGYLVWQIRVAFTIQLSTLSTLSTRQSVPLQLPRPHGCRTPLPSCRCLLDQLTESPMSRSRALSQASVRQGYHKSPRCLNPRCPPPMHHRSRVQEQQGRSSQILFHERPKSPMSSLLVSLWGASVPGTFDSRLAKSMGAAKYRGLPDNDWTMGHSTMVGMIFLSSFGRSFFVLQDCVVMEQTAQQSASD